MEDKNIQPAERMIGAISRLLKNGERVATGTLSPVPAAGCFLAKYTHAPDLELLIYGDPENRLSEGFHELFGLPSREKSMSFSSREFRSISRAASISPCSALMTGRG